MDTLRLESPMGIVDLYSWLSAKAQGHEALAGILGFGLPPVDNQWFDGAGSGSSWRGSRVGRRAIELPLKVYASDRSELNKRLSELATVLDPLLSRVERGVARLFFGMPDDHEWYLDVVRAGGGDWARKVDSDDRTFFKTTLQLETGDSFWTRDEPESFEVRVNADAPTLLPYMARLRVSSATAFGVQDVENVGDTFAWPVFTATGPFTRLLFTGSDGETIEWIGTVAAGRKIIVDMRAATVKDDSGLNVYNRLSPAPRFWSIRPGSSQITVQADNSTVDTVVLVEWWPRRWAVA